MADWNKWDGKYDKVNNKNRPAGVGTVSQARRQKMRAKALAREAAEAAAAAVPAAATPCQKEPAKESATPCQKEPAKESATPCQKEFGPSAAEKAKEQGAESSSSSSSSPSTSSSSMGVTLPKKAKVEETSGEGAASSSNDAKMAEKKQALDKRGVETHGRRKEKSLDKRDNKQWQQAGHGIWKGNSLDKRDHRSPSTVAEPEPQWILKEGPNMRVAIDYHQTLEVFNSIPGANVRAVQALVDAGYQVFLCSFAYPKREQEVRDHLAKVDIDWTALKFTRQRCGPEGKAAWLEKNGIGHLFDDNREICEEAMAYGIQVWPIITKWQPHAWCHLKFGNLWKAIHHFLQCDGKP